MLNFPGLRGPADVRGGGPHAGAPGPAKVKERGTERSCHCYQRISHSVSMLLLPPSPCAGDRARPTPLKDSEELFLIKINSETQLH